MLSFVFHFLIFFHLENALQNKFTDSNNCQRFFREAPSWSMEFYSCWSAPFIPRNSNCGSYLRACAGGVFVGGMHVGVTKVIGFWLNSMEAGRVWRWSKVKKSFFWFGVVKDGNKFQSGFRVMVLSRVWYLVFWHIYRNAMGGDELKMWLLQILFWWVEATALGAGFIQIHPSESSPPKIWGKDVHLNVSRLHIFFKSPGGGRTHLWQQLKRIAVCLPSKLIQIPLRWRGHGYSYIKGATNELHGKWEHFLKWSLLTFTIQCLGRAQYRNMYIIHILIANDGCFKGFPAILLVLEDMKLDFCFLGECFTF